MNEERPVEKLLRRFAKKRREASGSSPQMHPATRRMLQSEVARRFPKPASAEKTGFDAFMAFFASKWTYAVGILLILIVSFVLLTPVLNKEAAPMNLAATDESTFSVARSDIAAPSAAPVAESFAARSETITPGADTLSPVFPAASPASSATFGGSNLREVSDAPISKSKNVADTSASVLNFNVGRSENESSLSDRDGANDTNRDKQLLARGGGGNLTSESQLTQNFFRQSYANDAPAQTTPAIIAGEAKTQTPVLSNFHIEQSGDEIRVIDGDGSTYNGVVETAPTEDSKRLNSLGVAEKKFQRAIENNSANSFQFRVAGTNRTLNQQVVFTWNYLPMTNAVTLTNGRFAADEMKKPNLMNAPQQFPGFQNLHLNGRVQISTGKEIEINARPVPQ